MSEEIRTLAFYLPQFHPIPENDEWWGKGFTEWTNVVKARPQFKGHYQPHLPADMGFYDLRLPEVREAQAQMAKEAGIHGFCYYHYWFNGRRILERPFNEVLASGNPDFPFCLCWANENWTRAWDGGDRYILLEQNYSLDDDRAHIRSLTPAFRDKRYIRVNGKPLFLVYKTQLMPDPKRTAEIWREEAVKAGLGDLYIARVESTRAEVDPISIGFDAAVEFAPQWHRLGQGFHRGRFGKILCGLGFHPKFYLNNIVVSYDKFIERMVAKDLPSFKRFRCVTPGFDNTARRSTGAVVLQGNTPEKYGAWLGKMAHETVRQFSGDEQLLFVNAWNEWGEGNHLEPDAKWGRAFLDATTAVTQKFK